MYHNNLNSIVKNVKDFRKETTKLFVNWFTERTPPLEFSNFLLFTTKERLPVAVKPPQ